MHKLETHIATAGGAGFLPASGTFGSLVALLPLLPFYTRADWSLHASLGIISLLGLIYGIPLAAKSEQRWGEDPKEFVWDEVIGQWITLVGHALLWQNMLVGFFLFRFFDIFKPLGIRRLERLPSGYGVMLDDVAAGVAANLCLYGFSAFTAHYGLF